MRLDHLLAQLSLGTQRQLGNKRWHGFEDLPVGGISSEPGSLELALPFANSHLKESTGRIPPFSLSCGSVL